MCATKIKQEAQNPLILRCHRLMEAFAKCDDERDFYIDRLEGFLIYLDLDKPQAELEAMEQELHQNPDRYCAIPKLSFYETKKIMEGFVNEKVYDIDTKEKLLDIIQSKEARENFLEFIYDHHAEQEKWQQFYQERSRIRIIEWLRANHFHFVFEEDLDLPRQTIEKLKQSLFQSKVGKDVITARKALVAKAKTYYSNEALNPRPKRGRPPKQAVKLDIEPQVTLDIYTTVPPVVRPFLFTPEISTSSAFSIFSSKFDSEEDLSVSRRQQIGSAEASLSQKLASLRSLSSRWMDETPSDKPKQNSYAGGFEDADSFEDEEDEEDEDFEEDKKLRRKKTKATSKKKSPVNVKAKSKTSTKEIQTKSKTNLKSIKQKEQKVDLPKNETNQKKKTKALKKIIPKPKKRS